MQMEQQLHKGSSAGSPLWVKTGAVHLANPHGFMAMGSCMLVLAVLASAWHARGSASLAGQVGMPK